MPTDIDAHRAKEADRLANHEPLLVEALTNMRLKALNELATVAETDLVTFRRLQAKVACTEDFLIELQEMIVSGVGQVAQPE